MSSSSLTRNRPTSAASRENAPTTFRAVGPCTAMIARVFVVSTPPIASCTPVVLEALGMTSNTSSPTHHTMMSSNTQASFTSSKCVYCARPTEILFRSFVSAFCNRSNALSPDTRTVPKCDTSNSAAPCRHTSCSDRVPLGYEIGISQPPNGAILAFSSRCTASSGETLSLIATS